MQLEVGTIVEGTVSGVKKFGAFVTLPEGSFVADCVGPLVEVRPFEGQAPEGSENLLVVLFGNGLPARKAIKEACSWFPNAEVELM